MYADKFRGPKYDSARTTAQITAAIRADLKAAVASGALPAGSKFSVTKRSYSSVRVEVTACPGVTIFDRARLERDTLYPHAVPTGAWRHPSATAVVEAIEAIAQAYNRDNSDSSTDYFDTRFYLTVAFSAAMEAADRAAGLAEIAAPYRTAAVAVATVALDTLAATGGETDDRPRMALATASRAVAGEATAADLVAAVDEAFDAYNDAHGGFSAAVPMAERSDSAAPEAVWWSATAAVYGALLACAADALGTVHNKAHSARGRAAQVLVARAGLRTLNDTRWSAAERRDATHARAPIDDLFAAVLRGDARLAA